MKRIVDLFANRLSRRSPGWVGLVPDGTGISLARVIRNGAERPVVTALARSDHEGKPDVLLAALARDHGLKRCRCVTILPQGQYQTFQVEAPSVPQEELAAALRWRVKDSLPYSLEQAVVEALLLPQGPAFSNRAPQALVVAADKTVVERHAAPMRAAGIGLAAMDIPELSQRNLAALFEDENRGLAFLHVTEGGGLLTLNFQGELFAFRRIEGLPARTTSADVQQAVLDRIVLELQRSLDYFDRQFSFISISRLVLAGDGDVAQLVAFLSHALYLPTVQADWSQVLVLPDGMTELPGWAPPAIGAALRQEGDAP